MDISIVQPQTNLPGSQASAAPVVKDTGTTVLPKTETVQEVTTAPKTDDRAKAQNNEEARFETVRRASQMFKDVYAVNDTKFTIFKDNSGQYITRFTNMRDGKVTYIPEPDILAYMESMGAYRDALVKIEA